MGCKVRDTNDNIGTDNLQHGQLVVRRERHRYDLDVVSGMYGWRALSWMGCSDVVCTSEIYDSNERLSSTVDLGPRPIEDFVRDQYGLGFVHGLGELEGRRKHMLALKRWRLVVDGNSEH